MEKQCENSSEAFKNKQPLLGNEMKYEAVLFSLLYKQKNEISEMKFDFFAVRLAKLSGKLAKKLSGKIDF